jgi:hypothetical protein
MPNANSIYAFTLNELEKQIVALGLKKHNATQLYQ